MLKVGNIATQYKRLSSLGKMIDSVVYQFDELNIYLNDYRQAPYFLRKYDNVIVTVGDDLTDNAKFYFLQKYKQPVYYFTLDDDIIYPSNYVSETINKINNYNSIITYHGRILLGTGLNYYKEHRAFGCFQPLQNDFIIDVCGTGVTAFSTEYFNPKHIYKSEYKKMSDLVFSLEASINKKNIYLCAHAMDWLKPIINEDGIVNELIDKDVNLQNKIADEIFKNKTT